MYSIPLNKRTYPLISVRARSLFMARYVGIIGLLAACFTTLGIAFHQPFNAIWQPISFSVLLLIYQYGCGLFVNGAIEILRSRVVHSVALTHARKTSIILSLVLSISCASWILSYFGLRIIAQSFNLVESLIWYGCQIVMPCGLYTCIQIWSGWKHPLGK